MKDSTLGKFIPVHLHLPSTWVCKYLLLPSSHTAFPAVILDIRIAAISRFGVSLFSCQSLRNSSYGRKIKYPPLRRASVIGMTDLCFSTHQICFHHATMRFSLATHSGNSFVSPLPWYFPCYDNLKKKKQTQSISYAETVHQKSNCSHPNAHHRGH